MDFAPIPDPQDADNDAAILDAADGAPPSRAITALSTTCSATARTSFLRASFAIFRPRRKNSAGLAVLMVTFISAGSNLAKWCRQ